MGGQHRLPVLLAAGVLAAALAAPAAGARPAVDTADRLPAGALSPASLPVTTPAQLLEAFHARDRRGDPDARLDAVATFVGERWQGTVVPENGLSSIVIVFGPRAWPAGDLTGDGRADVLTVSSVPGGGFELRAHRGDDGAPLWTRPMENFSRPLPVGDLTGDGRDDFLLYEVDWFDFSADEECDDHGCVHTFEETFRWRVGVVSGADGTTRWQRTYPAQFTWTDWWREDGTEYEWGFEIVEENGLVLPFVAGTDVVLNAVNGRWHRSERGDDYTVVATAEGERTVRADVTAEVISAATGEVRTTLVAEDAPGVGLLEPLDSDTLLWSAFEYTDIAYDCIDSLMLRACPDDSPDFSFTGVLQALDPATLDTRWEHRLEGLWDFIPLPARADLSGDGAADLFALTARLTGPIVQASYQTVALAGGDGAELWSRAGTGWGWRWPSVAGQIADGPGEDVLLTHIRFETQSIHTDPPGLGTAYHGVVDLDRVDGATGEALLSTTHRYEAEPNRDPLPYAVMLGDATGDGVSDVAVGFLDDWPLSAPARSRLTVESTATGATLYEVEDEGRIIASDAGDLTGDGRVELLEWRPETDAAWTAIDLGAGTALWSAGQSWNQAMVAGDQTGDGASEVLLDAFPDVHSLDGRTGAFRWTLRFD